jgi:hypothetical protein
MLKKKLSNKGVIKLFSVMMIMGLLSSISLISACDEGGQASCNNANFISTKITLKWYINEKLDDGQYISSYDSCLDVSALNMHVVLSGPDEFYMEETVSCNAMEISLYDDKCDRFPTGNYTASFTFVNSSEEPLSETINKTGSVVMNTQNNVVEVVIPLERFSREFTGTYMYDLTYGGETCETADATISRVAVSFWDGDTQLEEFGYDGGCINEDNETGLPAGDLGMVIVAYDATENMVYCESSDIKVGAGLSNPVADLDLTFDECVDVK